MQSSNNKDISRIILDVDHSFWSSTNRGNKELVALDDSSTRIVWREFPQNLYRRAVDSTHMELCWCTGRSCANTLVNIVQTLWLYFTCFHCFNSHYIWILSIEVVIAWWDRTKLYTDRYVVHFTKAKWSECVASRGVSARIAVHVDGSYTTISITRHVSQLITCPIEATREVVGLQSKQE